MKLAESDALNWFSLKQLYVLCNNEKKKLMIISVYLHNFKYPISKAARHIYRL